MHPAADNAGFGVTVQRPQRDRSKLHRIGWDGGQHPWIRPKYRGHRDLLIETGEFNERKVLEVLSLLPDGAAKELVPGEVAQFVVVRVCDEITVNLMAKACGHDYESVKEMVTPVIVNGVSIPFASPSLLWKTKQTYREKDEVDRSFLRKLLEDRGV